MKVVISMSSAETTAAIKTIPEIAAMANVDTEDVNNTINDIDIALRYGSNTDFTSYFSTEIERTENYGNDFIFNLKDEFIIDSFDMIVKIAKITQPIWSVVMGMKTLFKNTISEIKASCKEFDKKWSDEFCYFYRVYKFNGDDSDKWNVITLIRQNKVTGVEGEQHMRIRSGVGTCKTMSDMFKIWKNAKNNNGMFTVVYESSTWDDKNAAYADMDKREGSSDF